ncbi:MAG: shikimate dehydrogenase [Candidatus Bathyarchaeia archaeon]
MNISGKTKVCAVIGDPVEHSLSPCIHNAAFQHLQLDYVYVAFSVKREELRTAIQGVRSLKIHGLNVTTPHKLDVIQHLDRLDESAKNVGAANTILNKEGTLIGYNTDGKGALLALEANQGNLLNKKILILGAGGASRSISYTLAQKARELVVLNRTVERAESLVKELLTPFGDKVRYGGLSRSRMKAELEDTDVLINATTLGMHPNEDETPVDQDLLRPNLTIFDLVYHPLETRLLREAKAAGARTIDGLAQLIYQGAVSFEIWTGKKAPIEVMMKAAQEKLKGG